MSTTTFTTTRSRTRHARPSEGLVARVLASVAERRESARSRRELDLILGGHHGATMRNEMQSMIGRQER